jgi:hypothetical protein
MRASRDEWAKRVERWRDSGLSAEQFAAELGINAGTLKFWKYRLGQPVDVAPVQTGHLFEGVHDDGNSDSHPSVRAREAPTIHA